MEFLNLFMDCFFSPLSPDYADLEQNPLMMGMLAILLGIGLVDLMKGLLNIWSIK